MMGGQYVEGSLYFYAPNKGPPIVFAFLFLVSFVLHVVQCARYKSWKITLMLPWCALTFGAGYILREVGAFSYGNVNVYIASMTIIYSAPPLYEMSNYQVLSRLLYYIPYHSPIHPGRILTTMLGLSTIVETLNGNGVSYWANIKLSHGKQNMGRIFLKAALIVQLVVLLFFLSLTAFFHRKCKKHGPFPKNVRGVLTTLYCSSALIGIRAIYRTVEYYTVSNFKFTPETSASASPLIRYEAFFWGFEALLMLANSFLLNIRHPLRFFPRDSRVYLAEDGVTEKIGPGYEDLRFFVLAMLDPFDLIGLVKGRHMERKFWETEEQGKAVATKETVDPKESDVEKAMNTDEVAAGNENDTPKIIRTDVNGVSSSQAFEETARDK